MKFVGTSMNSRKDRDYLVKSLQQIIKCQYSSLLQKTYLVHFITVVEHTLPFQLILSKVSRDWQRVKETIIMYIDNCSSFISSFSSETLRLVLSGSRLQINYEHCAVHRDRSGLRAIHDYLTVENFETAVSKRFLNPVAPTTCKY